MAQLLSHERKGFSSMHRLWVADLLPFTSVQPEQQTARSGQMGRGSSPSSQHSLVKCLSLCLYTLHGWSDVHLLTFSIFRNLHFHAMGRCFFQRDFQGAFYLFVCLFVCLLQIELLILVLLAPYFTSWVTVTLSGTEHSTISSFACLLVLFNVLISISIFLRKWLFRNSLWIGDT